ncbi:HMOX2 [Symbiodinium natans]|uniref:HMOX2 protein n=1 Tax=Symbiodinium natans TaxID=878477 RepID=A0A812ME16_9DINO|nr:HMOX2 [Symbiodinium natans]
MAITVDVARLDGSVVQKVLPAEETVLGLKRLLANDAGISTAQFRLLLHDKALRNELRLSDLATDDNLPLQFVYTPVSRTGETVGFVEAESHADSWALAIQSVLRGLEAQGVEQGQVLWIDLHAVQDVEVACAYFCTELPGRGELQVAFEVKSGTDMEELHKWACSRASGREIISITMSSSSVPQHPLTIAIFYYVGELSQAEDVRYISVGGGAWEFAASKLVLAMHRAGVQHEQLLAVDAHNVHPDRDAMFCAYYAADRKGSRPVALDWKGFNAQRPWHQHHQDGCSASQGKEVMSITASCNCAGRTVQFAFWHVLDDLPEKFHVEMAGDAWEEAADQLIELLRGAGVQQGQVMSIDAHNKGAGTAAFLLAVVRRSRPGRGPLNLSCEVHRDLRFGWDVLYQLADQAAVGKEVVSVTGCSSGTGSQALLVFLAGPRPEITAVEHVASAAGSWNGAADQLLHLLRDRGVQKGQLLCVDAHNTEPNAAARFSAHFSRSLPGEGPLQLTYRCFIDSSTSNFRSPYSPAFTEMGLLKASLRAAKGALKRPDDSFLRSPNGKTSQGGNGLKCIYKETWWQPRAVTSHVPQHFHHRPPRLERPDTPGSVPVWSLDIVGGEATVPSALLALPAPAPTDEATVSGKPHEALMDMLKTVHKASQSMKQTVGADCPVFQEACPFKNCITSSGTPLAAELEWRSWGLWIGEEQAQLAEVQDEGLACKLKEGTKEAHQAAETVHFVKEFVRGRVSRQIYAQFVVNLYHIYSALEEALEANAEHPLIESLHFPEELERTAALKQDAAFFLGESLDMQEHLTPDYPP